MPMLSPLNGTLNILYKKASPYLHFIPTTNQGSKLLYSLMTENKKSTGVALVSSILYSAVSYYEFNYFTQVSTDLNEYKNVFSSFAKDMPPTEITSAFLPVNSKHLHAEEKLVNALTKGQLALAQYTAIVFCKPLLLEVCKHALTFSLRSALIREWLGRHNNQLGLQLLDKEISTETREIIYSYSNDLIRGVLGRISILLDFIITLGKAYDIYKIGNDLTTQGLDGNLLAFIGLIIGVYFFINVGLNMIYKAYSESALKEQLSFKNDLTFNMENALQIESSGATKHEFNLLTLLLSQMTKTEILQTILGISMSTVGMVFTNFISFSILGFSIASIVKNPSLYFSLENLCTLLRALCINLWIISDKVSSSATLSYSYAKINKFFYILDRYRTLSERENVQIITSSTSNLSCKLKISYPNEPLNINSSNRVLVENFEKEFIPGQIYGIRGPSGSGKSSFFNALAGINPFASGKVTITSQENIIYIPQKTTFKQNLSWLHTILYPLEVSHLSNDLKLEIKKWIITLKLGHIHHDSIKNTGVWTKTLSGGENQRLAIIQALAKTWFRRKYAPNETILLMLDESLNALDPEMQETTFQLLADHVKKYNITVLHIDHSAPIIINRRYKDEEHIIDFAALKSL